MVDDGTNNSKPSIRVPTTVQTSGVVIYQWDDSSSFGGLWRPMPYRYCSGSLLLSNTTEGHRLTLALSGDGKRLAVGDSEASNDSGAVRVYELTYLSLCDWHTVGDELHGSATSPNNSERFGASVSLSQDGTRLAVGAPCDRSDNCHMDSPFQNGTVYVFELEAVAIKDY
jgi:hypothetical protein